MTISLRYSVTQETVAHPSKEWGWEGDSSGGVSKVHLTRNVTPVPHNAACRSPLATLLDFIALVKASVQVCPEDRRRSQFILI